MTARQPLGDGMLDRRFAVLGKVVLDDSPTAEHECLPGVESRHAQRQGKRLGQDGTEPLNGCRGGFGNIGRQVEYGPREIKMFRLFTVGRRQDWTAVYQSTQQTYRCSPGDSEKTARREAWPYSTRWV